MSKSRFELSLLTLAAVLFLAESASAQAFHRKFELFTEGGVSMTNQFTQFEQGVVNIQPLEFGDFTIKSSLRTTGRLFAGVRFWVDKSQAFEVSYSYSPSSLLSSATCTPSCGGVGIRTIPLRANFFAGNYIHTLPQLGNFRPFLTAGAGVLTFFQESPGYVQHDPFTVNLGGGFDRNIARHWAMRTEYRDWIFEMPHLGSSASGLVHNMVPSIGPVFRF
ncbi:MAG: porin family protein [Candidatus Acidiferrales bacterium]